MGVTDECLGQGLSVLFAAHLEVVMKLCNTRISKLGEN